MTARRIATSLIDGDETAKQFIQRKTRSQWWEVLTQKGYALDEHPGMKGEVHYTARKNLTGGIGRWSGRVIVFTTPLEDDSLTWIFKVNNSNELRWYTPKEKARSAAKKLHLCTYEIWPISLWQRVKKEFNASILN
jgi:hypothetical protein